jgi:hypothetical protein
MGGILYDLQNPISLFTLVILLDIPNRNLATPNQPPSSYITCGNVDCKD